MFNDQQLSVIRPYLRTLHIEHRSVFNDEEEEEDFIRPMVSIKTVETVISSSSDRRHDDQLIQGRNDSKPVQAVNPPSSSDQQSLRNYLMSSTQKEFFRSTNNDTIRTSSSSTSRKMSSHQPTTEDDHLSSSSKVSQVLTKRQTTTQSVLKPIDRSQLLPDWSSSNDKQLVRNRIFNEEHSPSVTQLIIDRITKRSSSNNTSMTTRTNPWNFHFDRILTSTSSLLVYDNRILAQAATTTSDASILSETSFIILISMLTILILLCCLALVCLCRRHTQRTISPSFDGGNAMPINEHSFEIPPGTSNYHSDQYEFTHQPSLAQPLTEISIHHPPSSTVQINDIRLNSPNHLVALQSMRTEKIPIHKKKNSKTKRLGGFCCCTATKQSPSSNMINARTRMK